MEKVKYTRPLVNVVPLQGSCLLDNFNSTKQNQYLDTKNEQKEAHPIKSVASLPKYINDT